MNDDPTVFHEDRLIAALNKHWRPLSYKQYMQEMDIPMTNNAITMMFSEMTKEQQNIIKGWIWEEPKRPFQVFNYR